MTSDGHARRVSIRVLGGGLCEVTQGASSLRSIPVRAQGIEEASAPIRVMVRTTLPRPAGQACLFPPGLLMPAIGHLTVCSKFTVCFSCPCPI